MKTIYKYELFNIIEMPKGADILSLQTQRGIPYIWALIDTKAEKENRVFSIYGTDFDLGMLDLDKDKYIGTYQLPDRGLVWHVFEINENIINQ